MKRHARPVVAGLLALLVVLLAAASASATTFTLETVENGVVPAPDFSFFILDFPSVAVDASGNPHIAYVEGSTPVLKYGVRSAGTWMLEVVTPIGLDLVDGWPLGFPSIAIDPAGDPHIAYYDGENGYLRYASRSGGTWAIELVDDGYDVGRGNSLVLDAAGNPHIAYYDEGNSDLKYTVKSGGIWHNETVISAGFVGQQARLALDGLGNPHITYMAYTDGGLWYTTKSGGTWTFEQVFATPPATGVPNDVAVDAGGNVHVSFSNFGDLYYAFKSGGTWVVTTVDVPGNVGGDNSIALTSSGAPRISYRDGTNTALKYASKTGGAWTTEIVDAPGNVGLRSELALDGSGNPRIVYIDLTNLGVKVALGESSGGFVTGALLASCPSAGTPLAGVTVDAFDVGSMMLTGTSATDASGTYTIGPLPPGSHNIVVVTPLGYTAMPQEQVVQVQGGTIGLDFAMTCVQPSGDVRSAGFWKHQTGVALSSKGAAQVDGETLCGYLDLVALHFNSNDVNPVVVYDPPASGECEDKLLTASNLLNLQGSAAMRDRARQQLLALLLNVASGRLGTLSVISMDGATVSQAITYCDGLIDSPTGDYQRAKSIADDINNGRNVHAGEIPLTTQQIAYRADLALRTFRITPNPGRGDRNFGFIMGRPGPARLQIFDVSGRLVTTLADRHFAAGPQTVVWRMSGDVGSRQANGVYFARLETDAGPRTLKVLQLNP